MKALAMNIIKDTFNLLPAAVNPPKQYAKSVAAALTKLVAADLEFEPKEFQDACNYLTTQKSLVDNRLTEEALEYFKEYTTKCKEMMTANVVNEDEKVDFIILQSALLEEVKSCPDSFKSDLRAMVTQLRTICEGEEKKVANNILAAI